MRWIVGDVQGCAIEFDRLLAQMRFDPARDELWCLGDLVNRGPDSLETLKLWRDVGGRSLIGNHDVYALLSHAGTWPRKKKDTLEDLFGSSEGPALLALLRELPVMAHLEQPDAPVTDVWIVHAGLHPAWTDLEATVARIHEGPRDDGWLQSDDVAFATRVRCCTAEGEMSRDTGPPAGCKPPYRPWDAYYRGAALVVHGHWARRGYYREKRTMGLDSGCVYGGKLTAWCQEEDRVLQVPSRT